MKLFLKNKKGFTLIELILYVSISSTMLLALVGALSVVLESRVRNQTIAEVEQQGVQVMQIITQTLRNADSVNMPLIGTNSPSLSIKTFSSSTNPTVFDVVGGVVRITEGLNSTIPLTNSRVTVSNVSFQNLSNISNKDLIRVNFQIDYLNNGPLEEFIYGKTFSSSISTR